MTANDAAARLCQAGFPAATAWSPPESANHWFVIAVARDWRARFPGKTTTDTYNWAALVLFDKNGGMGTPKSILVNNDVDIANTKELVWVLATRNHPGAPGELVFGNENTNPLMAYLGEDEKMRLQTTEAIYDCLDPERLRAKLPRRSSFTHTFPAELQAKVLADWSAYGYPTAAPVLSGSVP